MLAVPCQVNPTEYSIFIVLEDENVERMKAYDPAELQIAKLGGSWSHLQLKNLVIMYATEEEAKELIRLTELGEVKPVLEMLRKLSRGFRYQPDRGDHDGYYTSLRR